MSIFLTQLISLLTIAAIGIGFWIGINALEKAEKKRPKLMIIGNLIYTLGSSVYLISATIGLLSGSLAISQSFMPVSVPLLTIGLFIFSIGFALHGLRTHNLGSRVQELELMNLAQATELERLRNR